MKLAAGYIIFDGLEVLEKSIKSIRSQVDLVIVSYQTQSWRGTPAQSDLVEQLESLRKSGLVDELVEFTDFTPVTGSTGQDVNRMKDFERAKRQSCLRLALTLGATHYLSMDSDEFYRESDFKRAKERIIKDGLDATAVRYINYVTPTLHRGYSRWLVPFIYRITDLSKHMAQQPIFSGVDPTRGVMDPSYRSRHVFDPAEISMHHMEMVRKDLVSKYKASSRYFPNMELLPKLESDIDQARETGWIKFSGPHLGDYDDPKIPRKLTVCENEFKIKF